MLSAVVSSHNKIVKTGAKNASSNLNLFWLRARNAYFIAQQLFTVLQTSL